MPALILAAACWGIGTVISKWALAEIPPLTLLPIQLASSLAVLTVLMRRQGLPFRDPRTPKLLGRLGLLNPGLGYALSLVGLTTISASLSVLLWATEPLLILLLAVVVLGERLTPSIALLSLAAFAGLVLVVYDPTNSGLIVGVSLTLAGVLCCAVYTVVARRWIGASDSTAQVVFAQQAHALALAVLVVLAVALAGGAVQPAALTPAGVLAAVVSGVLYYAAAYWLYLTALRGLPASVAAASFYVIPVFGVAAGALLLGERLDLRQWVGAIVVVGAVFAILRRRAPVAQATAVGARPAAGDVVG